jgi:hypothetical protein
MKPDLEAEPSCVPLKYPRHRRGIPQDREVGQIAAREEQGTLRQLPGRI